MTEQTAREEAERIVLNCGYLYSGSFDVLKVDIAQALLRAYERGKSDMLPESHENSKKAWQLGYDLGLKHGAEDLIRTLKPTTKTGEVESR